ncbi:uncharacterized protein [Antedon mediterranea]|uniref:uncharacterized protein n=1 Tax=Antedon mediterranea TaxID=105859 RepID=UPI003AF561D8
MKVNLSNGNQAESGESTSNTEVSSSDSIETVIHVLPSNSCSDWQSTDEGSWPSLVCSSSQPLQGECDTNIEMTFPTGAVSSSSFTCNILNSHHTNSSVSGNSSDEGADRSDESHCTIDEISSSEWIVGIEGKTSDDNSDEWPVLTISSTTETEDTNVQNNVPVLPGHSTDPIEIGDEEVDNLIRTIHGLLEFKVL